MQSLINSERSGLEMEIMEYRPHLHSTTLLLDCFSPLHGKTRLLESRCHAAVHAIIPVRIALADSC